MPDSKKNYEQAYNDYKKGMKTAQIAKKYNVPDSTVRSWKARYWIPWDKESLLQRMAEDVATDKKCCNTEKKRGAQPGNKNAVGHGAGKGNKNNLKHGIFQKLVYDTLPEHIKELLNDFDIDVEIELKLTIRICDLEIVRLLELIKTAEEKTGGQFINNISKSEGTDSDGKLSWKNTNTHTISANDLILRYRHELQVYLKQKVRCLESLVKISHDSAKLELDLIKTQAMIKLSDEQEQDNSNIIEALQGITPGVWSDD